MHASGAMMTRKAELRADLDRAETELYLLAGPAYPRIRALIAEIEGIDAEIIARQGVSFAPSVADLTVDSRQRLVRGRFARG